MAYLKENDLDVFIVTESWLQTTDTKTRVDPKPLGYDLQDERQGGGREVAGMNGREGELLSSTNSELVSQRSQGYKQNHLNT